MTKNHTNVMKKNKEDKKEYVRLIEKHRWHDDKAVLKITKKSELLPCDYIILRNNGIHLIGFSSANCLYLEEDPATRRDFLCELYGQGEVRYNGYNPHYDLLSCRRNLDEFLCEYNVFDSSLALTKRFVSIAVRPTCSGDYIWDDYNRPVVDRPINRLDEVLCHESMVTFISDNEIKNILKALLSLPNVKKIR